MARDLTWLSATELSALLEARELTSVELVQACLARVQAVDGRVKAFNSRDEAAALAAAREIGRAHV